MTLEELSNFHVNWPNALGPIYTIWINIRHFFESIPYDIIIHYLIALLLVTFVFWLVSIILPKLIERFIQSKQSFVFLEITPPELTEISSITTIELFNIIAGLLNRGNWYDKFLFKQSSYSCEIVSTREKGIRYLVRLSTDTADTFAKSLRTYLPGILVKETTDYLSAEFPLDRSARILEFKFSHPYIYPLDTQADLKKHDPLAYLTAGMTQLRADDLLAVQIILKPLPLSIRRETDRVKSMIHAGKFADWLHDSGAKRKLRITGDVAFSVTQWVGNIISLVFAGIDNKPAKSAPFKVVATPSDIEREASAKSKLEQTLFTGTVRALLLTDKQEVRQREQGLTSAFASFKDQITEQSLSSKMNLPGKRFQKLRWRQYLNREANSSLVLSSSEVAALYHFPYSKNNQIEDLIRVKSRELPAPLSLKQSDTKLDVVIGTNTYGNENVPVGLTLEQRQKHMYVIGKTGMGKTTMLVNSIAQDMKNGKGLAVFDPHGDMFQELLKLVPENRRNDVVVFDPSDREWPIGLNILSPGVNFTNEEDEQEWITSSVIAVFAKITAKEYWGPRMEHILRNATLTALQTDNPSLYTLQRLLTDKNYQKEVADTLKDPVLKQFWRKEFSLLGKMQLSSVTAPLTQRLGSFITTKMSRHILLQEKSTIGISKIMNEGKILLVNLSKGDLGEDMSFFFGVILTSIIWMAAYQRTRIPEKERRDFFLYVDEFQNFATPRFSEITSEGRKFHVSLIASHQNIAQIDDQSILKIVAGNANTIVCLKASPDDEKFILPFMAPEVKEGDIVNLSPYHFFMKTTNAVSENAFSGTTLPQEVEGSDETKNIVVRSSRIINATPREDVEAYLDKLFSGRLNEKRIVKKAATKPDVKPSKCAARKSKQESEPKQEAEAGLISPEELEV